MSEKTIIEINGIKMEIDLRHAVRIDNLQVGDRVKVLIKAYDSYKVYAGTIVGFEPFQNLPTIIVAYVVSDYSSADVKFLYFNSQSKETEIVKAIDNDQMDIDKAGLLKAFDRDIDKHEREIEAIREKRDYFLGQFRSYWHQVAQPADELEA